VNRAVDLSFFDDELRAAARLTNENREAMWPHTIADRVIDSLANHGFVVLGLALRSDGDGVTPPGLSTEIPISAFRPEESNATKN
jgi:hypothetical protein